MPDLGETTIRPLTVLVTGATGKVGRHLVRHLLADGHHVRALTRHPDTAGLPADVDLRVGDPSQPDAVAEAARGSDAAFLNWMGFNSTGARASVDALASEVEHIVYLSAAQLQHGTRGVIPGVWADVEKVISETGTDWTFLRAGAFAGNALEWAGAIRGGEPVLMPHPEAVRSSVHEADVAEVAWRLLVEPHHRGRAYAITGPEELSRRQEAEAIGEALGRTVMVRQQDTDEALEQLAARSGREFAEAAFGYWSTLVDDPERVSDDAARIIGHPTRPFAQWATDHREDFTTVPESDGIDMKRFEGKTAVVTGGGTRGIGRATASRLAAEGAHVFITGRRASELNDAVRVIGENATAVPGDITKLDDLDRLYEAVAARGKGLDVLFANAGAASFGATIDTVTEQDIDTVFGTNVKGTVFTVQKALPFLNDGASIIVNASTAAVRGTAGFGPYAASKAALRSFARTWANELHDRGVRVNTISPGPTNTSGIVELVGEENAEGLQAGQAASLPIGRIGHPDEIAAVVAFLASSDSSFMLGADISVDGGENQI